VSAPVIACPPYSEAYAGADIFSSLRMPSSIAPATVLEPANAALLAAKILGLVNDDVREKVKLYQHEQANKILSDDQEIQTKA
jgi:5-(carboxyamino)imidazole ribonucleotide mutase/phosphoribosylaminoimidazole-succinocarboxamide synthase